jgi:hypothetical protein
LSSGFGFGSGFGLGAASGVGAAELDSDVGASRTAVLVESARVDHVGRRERGGVELAGASEVGAEESEQAETAETARTRAVRRRRREGAWGRDSVLMGSPSTWKSGGKECCASEILAPTSRFRHVPSHPLSYDAPTLKTVDGIC